MGKVEGVVIIAQHKIEAILNNPALYEYEGLSWEGVERLREVLGVPEPDGPWMFVDGPIDAWTRDVE